jgi:hypothetical protein
VDYLKEFGGNITSTSLQLVLFFYQMGLIDTFTLIQFCVNSGTQYAAVVLGAASGNFSDIGLKVLFEPITGFGTGYQFIKAAKTLAERYKCCGWSCNFDKNRIYASHSCPRWW